MLTYHQVKNILKMLFLAILWLMLFTTGAFSSKSTSLYPIAEGTDTGGTYVGGAANFTNLQSNDGDATYHRFIAAGHRSVHVDDVPFTAGTIHHVRVFARARQTTTSDERLRLFLRIGGTQHEAPVSWTLGTSYAVYIATWTTNPATGAAWTWNAINGLQAGIKAEQVSDWTGEIRTTELWIVVDYSGVETSPAPTFYDFEDGGVHGWKADFTPHFLHNLSSPTNSTARAYTGSRSIAFPLDLDVKGGDGKINDYALVNPSPFLNLSTHSGFGFYVFLYLPPGVTIHAHAPVAASLAVKTGGNWKWYEGEWRSLTPNAWTYVGIDFFNARDGAGNPAKVSHTICIREFGLRLAGAAGSAGKTTVYIDTVMTSPIPPPPPPTPPPYAGPGRSGFEMQGVNLISWWKDTYLTMDLHTSLDNLRNIARANWVSIVVPWYQATETSNVMYRHPDKTPWDVAVIDAIQDAKARGLKVMLKPHIECENGGQRTHIDPSDKALWFSNYRSFISEYARIAQDYGVDLFCIGTELASLSNKTELTNEWTTTINTVKGIYTGPLVYAANCTDTSGWPGVEYKQVVFWGQLDYAGVDVYFPLTNLDNPTTAQLVAAWSNNKNGQNMRDDLTEWQKNHGKPVIFTEIGYQSRDQANTHPRWAPTTTLDLGEQADCYEAAFRVWASTPWLKGMFWWRWDISPTAGGSTCTDFTPQNKPAQEVLTHWYRDVHPPAGISNLTALQGTYEGEIVLRWTAPGDDGTIGTVRTYIVRYATSQIRTADFYAAWVSTYTHSWTGFVPGGSTETRLITGLTPGVTYFFAIKGVDEENFRGVWRSSVDVSGINTANFTWAQVDIIAPAAITNLSALPATDILGAVTLTWTAPRENGEVGGAVTSYDVRYAYSPFSEETWNAPWVMHAVGEPTPASPGTTQSMTITGLRVGSTYYFRIKSIDERGNISPIDTSPASARAQWWIVCRPEVKGPADNTGDDITDLRFGDGKTYLVQRSAAHNQMFIDAFTVSGVTDVVITSAIMEIYYYTGGNQSATNWVQWAKNGTGVFHNIIQPNTAGWNTFTFNLAADWYSKFGSSITIDDIRHLDVRYINNDDPNLGHDREFDYIVITISCEPPPNQQPHPPSALTQHRDDTLAVIPFGSWTNYNVIRLSFTLDDPDDSQLVRYQLQISTFAGFTSLVVDYISPFISATPSQITTFYITPLLPENTYFWRVRCGDNSGAANSWSEYSSGTAVGGRHFGIDLSSPTGHGISTVVAHITSFTVTVSVAVDLLSGLHTLPYSIRYSTSPGFEVAITTITDWFSGTSTHTLPGLIPNTTYYFQARARDAVLNISTWSAIFVGVTLCNPPGAAAFSHVTASNIRANWTAAGNPSGTVYVAERSTCPAFTGTIVSSVTLNLYADFSGLSPNTTYWFRVKARNHNLVDTTYTTLGSTKTISIPNAPTALGQYTVDWITIVFSSRTNYNIIRATFTQTDPDPANLLQFTIQFSTYPDFQYSYMTHQSPLLPQGATNYITPLLPDGTWYWRVWSTNNYGYQSASSTANIGGIAFIIDTVSPAAITNLSALTGIKTGTINLTWTSPGDDGNADPLISGSRFHIATTTVLANAENPAWWAGRRDIAEIQISTGGILPGTHLTYTIEGLSPGVTYYFRIWTRDETGNWSTISNGATAYAKPAPLVNEPPYAPSGLAQYTTHWVPISWGSWINYQTVIATFTQSDPNPGTTVQFTIQFSTTPTFTTVYINFTSPLIPQGPTNYITTQLLYEATWYWRVWTTDSEGLVGPISTANPSGFAFAVDTTAPTGVSISVLNIYVSSIGVIPTANDIFSGLHPLPYYIQFSTWNGFTGTTHDSGWVSSYTYSGLSPNTTYWLRIKARDKTLNESGYTFPISIVTKAAVPGAITFGPVTTTSIQLSWGGGGNPAWTEYFVESSTRVDTAYGVIWSGVGTGPITHSGLNANTTYYYRVRARNLDGEYTNYNTERATSTLANIPIAQPFSNVFIFSITANWSNNNNPAWTRYYCEVSSVSPFSPLANSGWITQLSWTATNLVPNTTYYFRVKAINNNNIETDWVDLGSTRTLSADVAPYAPSNLAQYTTTWVSIPFGSWINYQIVIVSFTLSGPDPGRQVSFTIQFSTYSDFSFNYIKYTSPLIPQGTTNYTTPKLLPEGKWYWRVWATDDAGFTGPISTANPSGFAFGVDITPPINIGIVSLTPQSSSITVQVTAEDIVSGLHSYCIECATSPMFDFKHTGWISQPTVTFENLTPNTTYWFRAKTRDNALNESGFSVVVATSTLAKEPLPDTFTVFVTSITVSWKANDNPVWTEYYCEVSRVKPFSPLANSGWITQLNWTATGLAPNTTYYFRVKARNNNGIETAWVNLGSPRTELIPYYSIAGYVKDIFGRPIRDVTVTLTGPVTRETITNFDGHYKFVGLESNKSYTVTPRKQGWIFDPPRREVVLSTNVVNLDFIGKSEEKIVIELPIPPLPGQMPPEARFPEIKPPAVGKTKIIQSDSTEPEWINQNRQEEIYVVFRGKSSGRFTLRVFNLLGEKVSDDISVESQTGVGYIKWIPKGIPSGVYILHIEGPGVNKFEKILIMR